MLNHAKRLLPGDLNQNKTNYYCHMTYLSKKIRYDADPLPS